MNRQSQAEPTNWIGKVPSHWNVKALKYCADLVTDRVDGSNVDSLYIGLEHIEGKTGRLIREEGSQEKAESTVNSFRNLDVLFGKLRPYLAKAAVAESDGVCSSEILVYRPHGMTPQYLKNVMLLEGFIEEVNASTYGSKMPRADAAFISRLPVPQPPIDEQIAIAAYLDAETKRIDELIGQKGLLVHALGEMRHAAVNDAISGRSVIDKSCPPNKWEKSRLRFMASVSPRPSIQLDPDAQVSFLPMESIGENGTLKLNQLRRVDDVAQGYTYFEEGDVTVAKITPCFENGKGAVMKELVGGVGFGTTELIVLRPESNVDAKFLYYVTQSAKFRLNGEASMCGAGGQKRVSDLFIKDFEMAWPALETQKLIATHLDIELDRIDHLGQHVLREMELLNELRATTITDAVLGRIDVRKAQTH